MSEMRLKVTGMDCGGCIKAVTRAIQGLDKNAAVEADLASGDVKVIGNLQRADVERAITRAGFGVAA